MITDNGTYEALGWMPYVIGRIMDTQI